MSKFVELADFNASAKLYKRTLDMDPSDIRAHIGYISYYRVYIELADKVRVLQGKRSGATESEKREIRKQVRELQAEYKQKIIKARGLIDE